MPADNSQQSVDPRAVCDQLWKAVKGQPLDYLSVVLGYQPQLEQVDTKRYRFEDSGMEVLLWTNDRGDISMVSVKHLN